MKPSDSDAERPVRHARIDGNGRPVVRLDLDPDTLLELPSGLAEPEQTSFPVANVSEDAGVSESPLKRISRALGLPASRD